MATSTLRPCAACCCSSASRWSQQPAPEASRSSFYSFLLATNFSYLLAIIRERFVVIVVGLFVGAAAAGLYRLADQLANSINRLTEVFARPMFAEHAQSRQQ